TGPGYGTSWNTGTATNSTHALTAIATDKAGHSTTSSAVVVTVDTIPPSLSLTTPASGANLSGTVTLSASATDRVAMGSVQFQLNGVNLGSAISGAGRTYSYSWDNHHGGQWHLHTDCGGHRCGREHRDSRSHFSDG
ncbi:MAG: Ig-like domain-containing protein, partial [Bryobacteraceae bacterium]